MKQTVKIWNSLLHINIKLKNRIEQRSLGEDTHTQGEADGETESNPDRDRQSREEREEKFTGVTV